MIHFGFELLNFLKISKEFFNFCTITIAGSNSNNNNDDEIEKTLAIFIGLIAGVAVLIVFLSLISKALEKKGMKKSSPLYLLHNFHLLSTLKFKKKGLSILQEENEKYNL